MNLSKVTVLGVLGIQQIVERKLRAADSNQAHRCRGDAARCATDVVIPGPLQAKIHAVRPGVARLVSAPCREMPEARDLTARRTHRHRVVHHEAIERRRSSVSEVRREQRRRTARPVVPAEEDGGKVPALLTDHQVVDAITVDVSRAGHGSGTGHPADDHVRIPHEIEFADPRRLPPEQDVHSLLLDRAAAGQTGNRHRDVIPPIAIVVAGRSEERATITAGREDRSGNLQCRSYIVENGIARRRSAYVEVNDALPVHHILANASDEVRPGRRRGRCCAKEVAHGNHDRLIGEADRSDGERILVPGRNVNRPPDFIGEAKSITSSRRHLCAVRHRPATGPRWRQRIAHLKQIIIGHALKELDRNERQRITRVRVSRWVQHQMFSPNKIAVHQHIREHHIDHLHADIRGVRCAQLLQRVRRAKDIPILRVTEMEAQARNRLSRRQRNQTPRELHRIVHLFRSVPGQARSKWGAIVRSAQSTVGDEFESIRWRCGSVARQQVSVALKDVITVAACDDIIALATQDEIRSGPAIDRVLERAAIQAVVAGPAANRQSHQRTALLECARLDAPRSDGVRENEAGIAMHLVIAGAGVDHRALHVPRLVEGELLERRLRIQRVSQELLVRSVPNETRELVAVQDGVELERDKIRHRPAELIEIATKEPYFVVAKSTVEPVAQGRDESLRAAGKGRQMIRDDLESIVAVLTEQKIFRLTIQPARQHVIARAAKDPLLARATGKHIVAVAAENHIAPDGIRTRREINSLESARFIETNREVVNRRHAIGRRYSQEIRGGCAEIAKPCNRSERQAALPCPSQIDDTGTSRADGQEQFIPGQPAA